MSTADIAHSRLPSPPLLPAPSTVGGCRPGSAAGGAAPPPEGEAVAAAARRAGTPAPVMAWRGSRQGVARAWGAMYKARRRRGGRGHKRGRGIRGWLHPGPVPSSCSIAGRGARRRGPARCPGCAVWPGKPASPRTCPATGRGRGGGRARRGQGVCVVVRRCNMQHAQDPEHKMNQPRGKAAAPWPQLPMAAGSRVGTWERTRSTSSRSASTLWSCSQATKRSLVM